jgi:hypothetical protein
MFKWFVFNALLFGVVSYLGHENKVQCVLLSVIFAILHHVLGSYVRTIEGFSYMPDTRPIPDCPKGMDRGRNGMDCKSKGDMHGL